MSSRAFAQDFSTSVLQRGCWARACASRRTEAPNLISNLRFSLWAKERCQIGLKCRERIAKVRNAGCPVRKYSDGPSPGYLHLLGSNPMRSYYYNILASTPRCGNPLSGFDCSVDFAYRTENPFSRAVITGNSPLSQALSVTATSTGMSLLGPKARYRFAKKIY